MAKRLTGFNANLTALQGTAKTTAAVVFEPMLQPLTKLVQLLNDAAAGMGTFAENHKTVTKVGNYLAGGAVAGAAGFAGYQLLMGGAAGSRVLKGIGGFRGLLSGAVGTGIGVGEGMALQAATGVQPVFVTNMPGGFAAGASGAVTAEAAAGAGGVALAPVVLPIIATAAAIASKEAVKAMTRDYINGTDGNRLAAIRNQHMVMGGGANSYQVRAIDDALAERVARDGDPAVAYLKERWGDHGALSKNDITLNISIDGNGRATTTTSDQNTNAKINMKRGSFEEAVAAENAGH